MKLRPATNILGLAISDRGISCAEVASSVGKGRHRASLVRKLAFFPLPPEKSFEQPEAVGAALGDFLRAHGFAARSAVVGVPARWIIAQPRELPPIDDQAQAIAMLRLQAERMAPADVSEMVFDVVGDLRESSAPAAKGKSVLLAGMMREHADRLKQMCASAGLTAEAITPTSLALSSAAGASKPASDRPMVVWSQHGGADVVWNIDARPHMLRHIAGADASAGAVGAELRRAFAIVPAGNGVSSQPPPPSPASATLWNDRPLDPEDLRVLAERSGMKFDAAPIDLRALNAQIEPEALNGDSERLTRDSFLPAIALATSRRATMRQHTVDFLHSRLAPPRESRISRRAALIASAAVLAVALLAGLYVTVLQRESEAIVLEDQIARLQPDVDAASARVNRVGYGRNYFQARSAVLECLREISLAFHPDDAIWTTSFSFRGDTNKGQLQGRASNQQAVLTLRDRLKASPLFADVQHLDMRESAGGNSRDVVFSITFTFEGQQQRQRQQQQQQRQQR